MPRRIIQFLVSILALAVFTVRASDFWLTKDWHHWSWEECNRILTDSPWTHIWKVPPSARKPAGDPKPIDPGVFVPSPRGPDMTLEVDRSEAGYHVQLKSAPPIREAIVRRSQLSENYDKMTQDQRDKFDLTSNKILSIDTKYPIVVHVNFSKGSLYTQPERIDIPDFVRPGVANLHPVLITEDGTRIKPTRVDADSKAPYTFEAFFPRTTDGLPNIKVGQKRFTFQFETPESVNPDGEFGLNRVITVKFDLTRMSIGGNLSF